MDIDRGNLEILYKEMDYSDITLTAECVANSRSTNDKNNYQNVRSDLFLKGCKRIYGHYSEDEQLNAYHYLCQQMGTYTQFERSVFQPVVGLSEKILTFEDGEPRCRYEELLRWRAVSFQLGQDFLVCAYMAKRDLDMGWDRHTFSWNQIIRSDNKRLSNILDRGVA